MCHGSAVDTGTLTCARTRSMIADQLSTPMSPRSSVSLPTITRSMLSLRRAGFDQRGDLVLVALPGDCPDRCRRAPSGRISSRSPELPGFPATSRCGCGRCTCDSSLRSASISSVVGKMTLDRTLVALIRRIGEAADLAVPVGHLRWADSTPPTARYSAQRRARRGISARQNEVGAEVRTIGVKTGSRELDGWRGPAWPPVQSGRIAQCAAAGSNSRAQECRWMRSRAATQLADDERGSSASRPMPTSGSSTAGSCNRLRLIGCCSPMLCANAAPSAVSTAGHQRAADRGCGHEQPQRTAQPGQRDGDAAEREERHQAQKKRVAERMREIAAAQALHQARCVAPGCDRRMRDGWRGTGSTRPGSPRSSSETCRPTMPNSMPPASISTITPGIPVEIARVIAAICASDASSGCSAICACRFACSSASVCGRSRSSTPDESRTMPIAISTSSGRKERRRFIQSGIFQPAGDGQLGEGAQG